MLSSIHPLGERAKGNSFTLTATAFVVGALAGGATTGLVGGLLGLALRGLAPPTALGIVAAVTGLAVVFESTGRALPSLRRQVDEDWLQKFRGWVYGVGFGFQLGAGVLTYITSAAVPVVVAAAVLAGSIPASVVVGGTYGAVRGLSIIPARRIDTPERLIQFHRDLHRGAARVETVSTLVLAVTATAAGVVAL